MPETRRVALLIETSRAHGRGLLRGVKRYMSEHGPWSVFLERRDVDSAVPTWLKKWRGDGILVRTDTQAMADAVKSTGVPAVELRPTTVKHSLPHVGCDHFAVGELAAKYFRELNFQHFGCCVLGTHEYYSVDARRQGFLRTLSAGGYQCSVFQVAAKHERSIDWERQQSALVTWLKGLAKPAGILASSDEIGFWLLDACLRAGVSVPEEIAVVGVENDEVLCSMASPPLSSVYFDIEQIGYHAAGLLDRMMDGQKPPKEPILFPPVGIMTRQSSDLIAIEDREVAAAVRFIRENACRGIAVGDVIKGVHVPRRSLERRMRAALGRSLKDEISRVQLNRVHELLAQTKLSLVEIAVKAGFEYPQYMNMVFKRKFGQTPGAYRRFVQDKG